MKLTFDIGNTAVKWASFEGRTLTGSGLWDVEGRPWGEEAVEQALVCASGGDDKLEVLKHCLAAQQTPVSLLRPPYEGLPVAIGYRTPATLGADRVAAACGARALHPADACLVIDAGTCITVDFVDAAGTYHGGAIMPGLGMNLQALHTFTAKLPLISLEGVEKAPVLWRTTEESILAGTLGATLLALAGYVALYRQKSPTLHVLLTGGDADRLAAAGTAGWELQPHLTLIGLNEILTYNEK